MSDISLLLGPAFIERLAAHLADQLAARQDPPRECYLNVEEAAEYLACGRRRIYDLVERGAVIYCRDGKRLLFRRADLDSYVSVSAEVGR